MFLYIIYLVSLLSIIAFSPTRYFSLSYIVLVSAIPGLVYCLVKHPSKIQTCLLLMFILSIYSGWDNHFQLFEFGRQLSNKEVIASSSIWLLSFIVMKLILINRTLQSLHFFKIYIATFFILGVLVMIGEILWNNNSLDEGSNSVYYVLPVLPCFIYCFPKYRYFAMILVVSLIILSIKRSAFLIVAASGIWLIFCSYKGIIKINKNSFKILAVITIAFIIISVWGLQYIDAIMNRFASISEDGGSHRDLIFEYAWELFTQTNTKQMLFGNGPRFYWYMSSNISATHNDFLEILLSCGIVGILLFLYLHTQLIKMLLTSVRWKMDLAVPMGICYLTFIIWNMIASQFAYQSPTVCTFMFIALAEHIIKNEKDIIYCNKL